MLTTFLWQKGKPLQREVTRAQMLAALAEKDALLWVDFEDPNEFESDALVEIFNFHDLAIDDCLNDLSHPKVDDYEEYLFMVTHAVRMEEDQLVTIELDIFLGKNYVVTFHKNVIRSIEMTRETVARKPDSYLGHGGDTLVYHILDLVVDRYQPVLDCYEDKIDALEDQVFNSATKKDDMPTIMQLKKDIFHFRRIVAPQRDMLNYLTRTPTAFIKTRNMAYFRDVYDHLFRMYGSIEAIHESLNGLIQAYFSYSSHKMNEAVKRMTVMATLTMPAVIISGIYGMNFHYIPELHWHYGYFYAHGLIAMTSLSMLGLMKYKKWI